MPLLNMKVVSKKRKEWGEKGKGEVEERRYPLETMREYGKAFIRIQLEHPDGEFFY